MLSKLLTAVPDKKKQVSGSSVDKDKTEILVNNELNIAWIVASKYFQLRSPNMTRGYAQFGLYIRYMKGTQI